VLPEKWPERAYRDAWLLFITILALVAIVLGNHENNDRINDIQRERARALILVCNETNKQNRRIVKYVPQAARAFPQTDCAAVVNRIIK